MAKHVLRSLGLAGAAALSLGALGAARVDSVRAAKPDETLVVDAAAREKMMLCTDGKSHYVIVGPHERVIHSVYYGDAKTLRFNLVPGEPHGMLSGTNFLDPRFFNKTANPSFRGVDVRNYSEVEIDAEKQTCAVRCGARTVPLTFVPAEKAREIVKKATFYPNPQKYVPYGLARDDRGTYYYVDHGATEKTEKDFRLFAGQKGSVKSLKMTNVVSDSEGDIFSTPSGSLRLILEKNQSLWVEGDKRSELKLIPIESNLQLIYNDLGVYVGQKLGTPCDDL